MKKNQERPWLTSTGVEIPTVELREIAKSWSVATWSAYLKWFESGSRERLLKLWIYDMIGDEQTESVFEQFGHEVSLDQQHYCRALLDQTNDLEAKILRQIFFEGRTIREIAARYRVPKSTVHDFKKRALLRLQRGNSGDGSDTRQFMRGENFSQPEDEPSIWDGRLAHKLKEKRFYDPENYKAEFERIKAQSIRAGLLGLSARAGQILYLRYWCDFSVAQISRRLDLGMNVVEEIESASISKVKRAALEIEIANLREVTHAFK